MSSAPAFQFYPKQWLADDVVLLMDWDARAMHMHLLCIAWQQDPPCTLPADDLLLKKWLGNSKRWSKVRDQILRAWKMINGRWVSEGLLREHTRQQNYSASRKLAAEARWGKENAHALHTHSVRNALQSSSSIKNKEKKAVPTSSATASSVKRMLKVPDEAFIAQLKQNAAYRGLEIDRELGKLRAWLQTPKGKGKHLTQQRLVNWLNNAEVPMRQTVSRQPIQVVL